MRNLSKKRQARQRKADKLRDEFRLEFERCWLCGREAHDIHEMTPGNGPRAEGYEDRSTWIRACRECHDGTLQKFQPPYDLAGQLALKARWDWEHYDRLRVIEIKVGRIVETYTMESEVIQAAWQLAAYGTRTAWRNAGS